MLPLVLSLSLAAPPVPTFTVTGTGDDTPTGVPTAISLSRDSRVNTPDGEKIVKEIVSLRVAPTCGVPPRCRSGRRSSPPRATGFPARSPRAATRKCFDSPPLGATDLLPIASDTMIAAVWLTVPPADTPADPAKYAWLPGTPPRDVLLYGNGDIVRDTLTGFTVGALKFAPDSGPAREVPLKDLAAIGFNPYFARPRKLKGPYAHLVLTDGTRLNVTEPAIKDGALVAKAVCGPAVEIPLNRLVRWT